MLRARRLTMSSIASAVVSLTMMVSGVGVLSMPVEQAEAAQAGTALTALSHPDRE